jgi:RNA polymerase sigma factor for flagellar operon FliA
VTPEEFQKIDLQVRIIAGKYGRPRSLDLEDLISDGWVGALDAIRRFDASKGFTLNTFIAFRILGEILDGARRADPLSRRQRKEVNATLDAAVAGFDIPVSVALTISLDSWANPHFHSDGATTVGDLIPCSGSHRHFEILEARRELHGLMKNTAGLTEREQLVLESYWLDGIGMLKIAKEIGVNESRVSQIAHAAIVKIRMANGRDTLGRAA